MDKSMNDTIESNLDTAIKAMDIVKQYQYNY